MEKENCEFNGLFRLLSSSIFIKLTETTSFRHSTCISKVNLTANCFYTEFFPIKSVHLFKIVDPKRIFPHHTLELL